MTAPAADTRLYSTKQVADQLGIPHETFRKWITRKHVRRVKVGTRNYVPAAEVARLTGRQATDAA